MTGPPMPAPRSPPARPVWTRDLSAHASVRREGGAAAARATGIAAATGEFVAFLDADDVLELHMFAMTVAAADRHPTAAMIFGPTLWWYPDGDARDWVEPTYRRAGRVGLRRCSAR